MYIMFFLEKNLIFQISFYYCIIYNCEKIILSNSKKCINY